MISVFIKLSGWIFVGCGVNGACLVGDLIDAVIVKERLSTELY